ncbi:hypothetical protein [Methylocaldum sp.]|uniref:hypothetical protein n=1 Tax=Methylocaldum sp. TaxID=1969727 RepID=UPI002D655243|nr:hypothetical protein [Methylocaldum sp.]HYE34030.1 hypothetical protein [Methylocaldum sp.]
MTAVALILSLMVAGLGALGVVSPQRLLDLVRRFETPAGLYIAAAFRLILGLALLLAASDSRAPNVVRILGIVIFVTGLVTPLIGIERFQRLIEWWSGQGLGFMRTWAGLTLAFGMFLAYAMLP